MQNVGRKTFFKSHCFTHVVVPSNSHLTLMLRAH